MKPVYPEGARATADGLLGICSTENSVSQRAGAAKEQGQPKNKGTINCDGALVGTEP